MSESGWPDAALLLVGHGSSTHPGSLVPVLQHAETLRRRSLFGQVLVAFWKAEPTLTQAWATLRLPRVFVVPLAISEGWFTTEALPEALGLLRPVPLAFRKPQWRGAHQVYYCDAVGTHAALTQALAARARAALEESPGTPPAIPRETALFVAGHGTERQAQSRASIDAHAGRLRQAEVFGEVHTAFLEQEPRIADCLARTTLRDAVVVPFFIADGLHTQEDIPVLLGASPDQVRQRLAAGDAPWRNPTVREGRRVWYTRAVGTEALIADIIVQRAREAEEAGVGALGDRDCQPPLPPL